MKKTDIRVDIDARSYTDLARSAEFVLFKRCTHPTEKWFYASSAQNRGKGLDYNNWFGRDAAITALLVLLQAALSKNLKWLSYVRASLLFAAKHQARHTNKWNGAQYGKFAHEIKFYGYEYLVNQWGWFLEADRTLRNYQSCDSTPLTLIAIYRYLQLVPEDEDFLHEIFPAVLGGLEWIMKYADSNKDGLYDYYSHARPGAKFGGLDVHSWMDSRDNKTGQLQQPVAPVELQAYVYMALRCWSSYFREAGGIHVNFAQQLERRAKKLKRKFNAVYPLKDMEGTYLASDVDAFGTVAEEVRSNMGHVLAFSLTQEWDRVSSPDGILDDHYIPAIVDRLLKPDMFDPLAGIRTLSSNSEYYDPESYHRGPQWTHDNGLSYLGFTNYGFAEQASSIAQAIANAALWLESAGMEQYHYKDGIFGVYHSSRGGTSNREQAWALAAMWYVATKELCKLRAA